MSSKDNGTDGLTHIGDIPALKTLTKTLLEDGVRREPSPNCLAESR
jgi:hypothetical protein